MPKHNEMHPGNSQTRPFTQVPLRMNARSHPYGRSQSQSQSTQSSQYPLQSYLGSGISQGYSLNTASSAPRLDQLPTSTVEPHRNHINQSQFTDISANESPYQSTNTHFPSTPTQSSSISILTFPSSPAGQSTTNIVRDVGSPPPVGKINGRGANFSDKSLKQLCKSWLQVSQDLVFGNDQKGLTFWSRIAADHNKRVSPGDIGMVKSLEARWGSLNQSMAKFAGYVEQIRGLRETGKGPDDIVIDALALYKQEVGSDFKDVDCYKILRMAPEWQPNPSYYETHNEASELAINSLTANTEAKDSRRLLGFEELPQLNRPTGNKKAKRPKSNHTDVLLPQMLANSTAVANSTRILAEQGSSQTATLERMPEHTILMSDTSHLDPQARADIEAEKALIIRKNLARGAAI